ncbi:hypothetical protein D3X11_04855 [Streptococcus sp. X16XC17]|uniref:GBS Bsp-like repeat-containing protein n=1 Tax=Streptococcus sp. X16XC17 TaxID=2316646 RepID=UPI00103F8801|nr:GBS Bsp-like repeat-containing protein [Streptococcus sp. X16XC17]TCD46703.1 hypothetical protein D3X11_04855 [Streptococcus sp. X16XC17]
MKTFKSLIYAGSLLGLFTLGQAVYADQVIAQPEVVTAQKDTTISAEVQAVFENDQLIITVTKLPFALQEVKGQLRMSDMDQKISDLVFGMQEDGSYQAKVESAVLPVESSKLMIQLDLVKNEDSLYALGGYEVDWQVNPKQGAPMGSSSSSLSSEQSSSSTSTDSQTSSSSEAGIEKEKTLMSEPTSESALQPSLSIENLQYQLGTFTVKVRNVPTSGVKEVRVPIWTEENRQDDLTWYTAIKQNDGTYQVQVDKKNHKNGIGTYQVHLYFVDNSGKVNGVTSTKASLNVNATGTIQIQQLDAARGTFTVRITDVRGNADAEVTSVQVPIWSDIDGQDDIKWYTATRQIDGSYQVNVNKAQHKNSMGVYHVHLYYVYKDGQKQGIAATKTTLESKPKGTITVENVNTKLGTFQVRVSNIVAPTGLKTVKIPVWTSANGQDDLKWYTATRQIDGSYQVNVNKAQHKNSMGVYHVHLYYVYKDGQKQGIAATKTTLESKPKGTITVENVNTKLGTFQVRVSNIVAPTGLKTVKIPVWTSANGQDDLKWYTATRQIDGSYQVNVNKAQHKNSMGVYHVHLYYVYKDGQKQGIAATKTTLESKPKGTITVENVNTKLGTFQVRVSNIVAPTGLKTVKIPVWTSANGQDDLKWYTATRQIDGSYQVNVNKAQHKNSMGVYHVHLYYVYKDGQKQGIAATKTTLESKPKGTITVENVNTKLGTFQVRVSNIVAPTGLKTVKIPVWTSANGQDDLKWYLATKQADGSYLLTVDKTNHKNELGEYQIHLYYEDASNRLLGVGSTKTTLTSPAATGNIAIENVDSKQGLFEVRVTNLSHPKGISSVQIPVWSDENGQDDIKWYAAGKQADGSYKVTVSLGNHKYSSGLYHAHLYVTHPSGEMSGVASTSAAINMLSVQPQGSLEITNRNLQTGSFDIIARILAPTAIKQVEVAVWGEVNGQNDLIWYTAVKQVDGTFKASVSQTNHKGEKGIYQVHLYMTPEVGNKTGLTTKTTVVDYKQALKRVIFLDPGHGGTDSGAYYGGVKEKDLAMGVANLLKAKLEAAGFTVLLSRTGDYYVDYVTARSQMANETNADLFISLHFNSSGVANSTAKGIETYWYESSDLYPPAINQALHNNPDRLAKSLTLANAVHGGMVSQTGASDRGVRRATFAVLRETEKPVVLVEMGFMDNESELTQIKQASYQNKLAIGLYQGIESFYATYQ